MGIIDRFYIGKAIDSFVKKEGESFIGDPLEGEDGGHGSGNWGHKGRPGLRGGSGNGKEGWTEGAGKGLGGKQYRGGTETNYYSSKTDWLNGLRGERQHEVQKWMESKGKNLAEQEKNVLTSGNEDDIKKMLEAKAEARGYGDNFEKLTGNISEEERKYLSDIAAKSQNGDLSVENLMSTGTDEERKATANILNKLMGGESHWEGELPTGKTAGKYDWATKAYDRYSDEYRTQRALSYVISQATGKRIPYDTAPTDEDVKLAEDILLNPDSFKNKNSRNSLNNYLNYKGKLMGYEDLLKNGSDISNRLNEILKSVTISSSTYWGEMALERNATTNPALFQEYMSLKSQLLGGPEIAPKKVRTGGTRTGGTRTVKAGPVNCVTPKDAKSAATALKAAAALGTTQEIAQAMAESGAFGSYTAISLGNTDTELAQGIARSYGAIVEEFPFMAGQFGSVESVRKAGAYASCYQASNKIEVSSTWYKDKAKMQAQLNRDISAGFHPANTDDVDSVITHEIGHAINNTISKKMNRNNSSSFVLNFGYARTASDILLDRVCAITGMSTYECRAAVSGYAKKNSSEWMSEAFAEYRHSSSPREICKIFYKELQNLIEEVGL